MHIDFLTDLRLLPFDEQYMVFLTKYSASERFQQRYAFVDRS